MSDRILHFQHRNPELHLDEVSSHSFQAGFVDHAEPPTSGSNVERAAGNEDAPTTPDVPTAFL